MEQLPESARQTFTKVMAAVGCGFFSYNSDLVFITFTFFTDLYEKFQKGTSEKTVEQAVSWFLSHQSSNESGAQSEEATVEQIVGINGANTDDGKNSEKKQQELINAGGLKLALYAISKHREATRHAMMLFNVLCQVGDQFYMIYANEI